MELESVWGICPNCGERETTAYLCMCPNKDRVRLFTESVGGFVEWTEKQDKTNPAISYWLPLYIQPRDTGQFQDLKRMSPNMTALVKSQDKIG